MITESEILERLKPLLTEVLGVKPEKIQLQSVLISDLGAESIDLLDLSFQIEETFHISIESNEIEREAAARLPGGVFESDGRLTNQALEEIRKSLPELGREKLAPGLRKADLPSLLTVEFFVKLIARKLKDKPEAPHA
jgi:acyl carrier protein